MLVFHVGRSLAFVDEPTAWAFDGQACIDAFGQFLVALSAAYFFHCKPVSGDEIGDRLDLLSRGWRVLPGLQAWSACLGLDQVLAHLIQSPVFICLYLLSASADTGC